jgi:hypothetical protein
MPPEKERPPSHGARNRALDGHNNNASRATTVFSKIKCLADKSSIRISRVTSFVIALLVPARDEHIGERQSYRNVSRDVNLE